MASMSFNHFIKRDESGQAVKDLEPGGQRQRVATRWASVGPPPVFLPNDPRSNLDNKLRVQTRPERQRRHRELGITSLWVTHDPAEATALVQRMRVKNLLKNGLNAGCLHRFDTATGHRLP